jgi:hypothetical protein
MLESLARIGSTFVDGPSRNLFEAKVAETILIRCEVAGISNVVVVHSLHRIALGKLFVQWDQPLVGVAGAPGWAHPNAAESVAAQLLFCGCLAVRVSHRPLGVHAIRSAVFALEEVNEPGVNP